MIIFVNYEFLLVWLIDDCKREYDVVTRKKPRKIDVQVHRLYKI